MHASRDSLAVNVLLAGANGFIGRYLLARLIEAGHRVVPAVRRPAETDPLLPAPASIAVDFNRDVRTEDWTPRLAGIEAVINCAGILQGRPGQSIAAIHTAAPKALFAACEEAGIKRVIQISAISAEEAAGTAYAATKRDADDFLAETSLDWVVLRPSLVYAEGAYGGTALFRALAAVPFAIPMIGRGDYLFQPIHVDDLCATVLRILDRPSITQIVVDPVGPETLTLRQIIIDLRRWLGFSPARILEIPTGLVRVVARLGDALGGPINTTALRQLEFGNVGNPDAFVEAIGIAPRRWSDALLARPSQAQDRWHAQLYFLRPLLRWTLALMWLASGAIGLLQPASITAPIFAAFGLSGAVASVIASAGCLLDIAIGALLLARRATGTIAALQLAVVVAYTAGLTFALPSLWADPFGPLLKNLPIMVAILILATIERDR
jgi:uncharacterized protein YbjT (DUF2867 family)